MKKIKDLFLTYIPYIALLQALVAMLGSLYFSEVLLYPPCVLCWYQRICMYPLFFIIGIGIIRKDTRFYLYVLPQAIIGWSIALFHNLLYYKIIPESEAPCKAGISCTTKFIEWGGFITIPLLSFTAFSIIIILMFVYSKYGNRAQGQSLAN